MPMQRVRFRVDFGEWCSVGEGKIHLLETIELCGSISQAARLLGMSYRRAWFLLESMKRSFDIPVVVTKIGGTRGGGVTLTKFGRELVQAFRDIESGLTELIRERTQVIARHVSGGPQRTKGSPFAVREKLSRVSTKSRARATR